MESIHRVKYDVRDLGTRAVTLFLSRAQVFRDISSIPLRPGLNEITINGLSPTIDDQSIKVEGSGSAIISDISVEPLPNLQSFTDVYPEPDLDSDDADDSHPSDDDDNNEELEEPDVKKSDELVAAERTCQDLEDELEQVQYLRQVSRDRLAVLEKWGATLSCEFGTDIEDALRAYQDARDEIAQKYADGTRKLRDLNQPLADARKQVSRLTKVHERTKAKTLKQHRRAVAANKKKMEAATRHKKERLEETRRAHVERQKYWPRYCYSVRIQLTASIMTPGPSRRGSVSSDLGVSTIDLASEEAPSEAASLQSCNLVLSYVTTSAYWSPSYDLQLSTSTGHGKLCFDAQLHNKTSETWDKCKVTLSTSQTIFGGVDEVAPAITPWKICSSPVGGFGSSRPLLKSRAEEDQMRAYLRNQKYAAVFKNRNDMFGVGDIALPNNHKQAWLREKREGKNVVFDRANVKGVNNAGLAPQGTGASTHTASGGLFGSSNANTGANHTTGSSLFGSTNTNNNSGVASSGPVPSAFGGGTWNPGVFGNSAAANEPQQVSQIQPHHHQHQHQHQHQQEPTSHFLADQPGEEPSEGTALDAASDAADEQLDYQESLVEETGFSTQYDLPGEKRLEPRSHASKQRVAQINLANTVFSHTVVAKYKPAAYLSAKLVNNSKLTLLKGAVGVTLDGSFVGRTHLPRFVGGEAIRLGLGVDPAIKVVYSSPEAKSATTGFFTKEDITIYDRVLRLENTRSVAANAPVRLTIFDQIPVANDDKTRVELLEPEGLVVGDEQGKPTGEAGRTRKEDDKDWGTAKAVLKRHGEVVWWVNLNPGKAVKLGLKYLVATPIGDQASEV